MNLDPCPFCRSRNLLPRLLCGDYYIRCMDCGCVGPKAESMDDAERMWNTRGE